MPAFILDKLVVRTEVHGQWFPAVGTDREQLCWDFHIFLPLDHFTNHSFVLKGFLTARLTALEQAIIALRVKKPFLLMDCGANAECRAEFLYQFGKMGSLYMQKIMKVENPRVALANNGEESTKGTSTVKEAYKLMQNAPYNFVGNIEGRQIPFGDADVVVADGFTGNLILKTYEGVAKVLMNGIKNAFMKNTLSKISYLGVKSGIDDMKKQFDYKEYGGAVMLGVKKPVIKSHGSAYCRKSESD